MLRKLVALVALGLLPISASAVAHAEPVSSLTLIDERGDMWIVGPTEAPPVAAPRQRRGDIRRTIIRHGERAVTVRTRFSELSRKPQGHFLVAVLRTNTGVLRDIYIVAGSSAGPPTGAATLPSSAETTAPWTAPPRTTSTTPPT